MTDVFETIREWPLHWGWITLFVIVFLRASATYGLGRAVAAGIVRRHEPTERTRMAAERIHRWGPWAVAASFFTVGIQSVINFTAGVVQMPYRRYVLGLAPGAAIWATIWLTVGLGAIVAVLAAGSGERIIGLCAVVLAVLGLRWWRRAWATRD